MLRGLFEGAQYNSEAGAKCAVYSRAQTKQGRGVIKEIRYVLFFCLVCGFVLKKKKKCRGSSSSSHFMCIVF